MKSKSCGVLDTRRSLSSGGHSADPLAGMTTPVRHRRVGKANGSRERAPDDRLRVPTSSHCAVGTAQARLCPPYETSLSKNARNTPQPSSPTNGSAEWPPDDRLQRAIQYSETSVIESKSCGVLDTPLEPVIGLAEGETRWRSMTVIASSDLSAVARRAKAEGGRRKRRSNRFAFHLAPLAGRGDPSTRADST